MLTTKTAGGLVSGTPAQTTGGIMRVRVLRGFMHNGVVPAIGSIVEVSEKESKMLIGSNKAEAAPAAPTSKKKGKKGGQSGR